MANLGHDVPKPRFYVVLNANPELDRKILMAYATSKVDERVRRAEKLRNPPHTIVVTGPEEYPGFSVRTAFDCNDLEAFGWNFVTESLQTGLAKLVEPVSPMLLERIKEGAHASREVSTAFKKLLQPPGPRD